MADSMAKCCCGCCPWCLLGTITGAAGGGITSIVTFMIQYGDKIPGTTLAALAAIFAGLSSAAGATIFVGGYGDPFRFMLSIGEFLCGHYSGADESLSIIFQPLKSLPL